MIFIFALLTSLQVHAYETGSAPFCVMDNYGNTTCHYYTLESCLRAAKNHYGTATCVKK